MLTLLQQFFRERVVVESIRLCKRKRGRRGVRQSLLRLWRTYPYGEENGLLLYLGRLGLFDKAQDHCAQHTAHGQRHAVQHGVIHHREHEDAAVGCA